MTRAFVAAALLAALALPAAGAEEPAAPAAALPAGGEQAGLLAELARPDLDDWQAVERELRALWRRSGSAVLDHLLARAEAALSEGRADEAAMLAGAVADEAPGFAAARAVRAAALWRLGRSGPALAELAAALAANPDDFDALALGAQMAEGLGEEARALALWRRAQALNPHRPEFAAAIERLEAALRGREL